MKEGGVFSPGAQVVRRVRRRNKPKTCCVFQVIRTNLLYKQIQDQDCSLSVEEATPAPETTSGY